MTFILCPICGKEHGLSPETPACTTYHYGTKKTEPINPLRILKHVIEYLETQEQTVYDIHGKDCFWGLLMAKQIVYGAIERLENELYGLSEAKERYYNSMVIK